MTKMKKIFAWLTEGDKAEKLIFQGNKKTVSFFSTFIMYETSFEDQSTW
jgi:hypothetical protein